MAGVLAVLLAGCVAAVWLTRDAVTNRLPAPQTVVDRRLLDTARQVAGLAETAQEVELARQAARLADHELDQAFATAVREAADSKPPTGGTARQLTAKVTRPRHGLRHGANASRNWKRTRRPAIRRRCNSNWRMRNWRWMRTSWKTPGSIWHGKGAMSGPGWSRRRANMPRHRPYRPRPRVLRH